MVLARAPPLQRARGGVLDSRTLNDCVVTMTHQEVTIAPQRPAWFERALSDRGEAARVVVDDVAISYRVWGQHGKPGIALVHGSNAHLEWWRFVAPFLADQFRVVAIDLSGNGDSGWRERYTHLDGWSRT